jgi:hypothetical protein
MGKPDAYISEALQEKIKKVTISYIGLPESNSTQTMGHIGIRPGLTN